MGNLVPGSPVIASQASHGVDEADRLHTDNDDECRFQGSLDKASYVVDEADRLHSDNDDEGRNSVETNNGCICCIVRGDLISGLVKRVKNFKKSGRRLEGVIFKTTGLADFAPVARTFFADGFVQKNIRWDGILIRVGAKLLIQHLVVGKSEGVEKDAVEQIALADRILLSTCDLVDREEELIELEKHICAINEAVPIKMTTNREVDMDLILGSHCFSLDKIIETDDAFLTGSHDHQHDSRASSVGIDVKGEVVQQTFNE